MTSSKPPLANSRARDYIISDSQELEQRSTLELSSKKVQKLIKQNNQLAKDVDSLKREKEALQTEKQKLKSDNKTLERELRRVSSKGEVQRLLKNAPAETDHDLAAEQRYLERDKKIDELARKIRATLERLEQNESDQSDDLSPLTGRRSMKRQNDGGVWESGMGRSDVQGVNSSLQKENAELRSKIASLEAELGQLVKTSPKTSRIKTGFFRRSKRQPSEQKQSQTPSDSLRTRSPDIPLSELLTFDTPSSSVEGTPIHKAIPAYISPNQSPKFEVRDARNGEIQSLKSRLKSATEEKKAIEEQNKALEAEVVDVRNQLDQLQGKLDGGKKSSEEVEKLKKSLKMANSEKTSLSGQIEHLRKEVDEVKAGKRSAEKTMMDLLKRKEDKIQELETECGLVSKERDRLQRDLELARDSVAEVKAKDRKIEELTLQCSKAKVESEKLRKELDTTKTSIADLKKKDSKIAELEAECREAKKECEKLQKQLDSAKSSVTEAKSGSRDATPMGVHSQGITAAKPPSGARLTSPSHSSSGRSAQSSVKTATSTSVKAVPSSPTTSVSEDSVFEADSPSRSKPTSSNQSTHSKVTRKTSDDAVERRLSSQSRGSKDSSGPPKLRKRRSSTELIELFEQSKEALKPATATADANVKRNTSYANLSTSPLHRAKVAATRAMFEGKNGEEATSTTSGRSDRSMYRRSWTGDLTQLRRSSYTDQTSSSPSAAIPEGKEATTLHTKSQSLDATALFKSEESAKSTSPSGTVSTVTANVTGSPKRTATTLSVAKPTSLNIGSNSTSSSTKVNGTHNSVSSTPTSSSSSSGRRTPNSATSNVSQTPTTTPGSSRTSKITFRSSSSTSMSPPSSSSAKLNAHKEVNEVTVESSMRAEKVTIPSATSSPATTSSNVSVNQRSRVTSLNSPTAKTSPVRSPTTPMKSPVKSPTTSIKSTSTGVESSKHTNSVTVTSNGVAKTPSYVPSYLRSNTVTGAETATNRGGSKVAKPALTRNNTAVTFTVTSVGSRQNPVKANVQPQTQQGILKRGSTLDIPSDSMKKASSLDDIPENVSENQSSSSTNSSSGSNAAAGNVNPPSAPADSVTTTTTSVMHRSPVPTRFQRRKREERPKTMYAGANRTETVSLVRLISKYQEQERREKEVKQTNITKTTAPASTQVSAVNGNASPIPAAATTFSSFSSTSSATSSSSGSVVSSQSSSSARRRPMSCYSGSVDL